MWLSRPHCIGHLRQKVSLIAYALMDNSLSLLEHRLRGDAAHSPGVTVPNGDGDSMRTTM